MPPKRKITYDEHDIALNNIENLNEVRKENLNKINDVYELFNTTNVHVPLDAFSEEQKESYKYYLEKMQKVDKMLNKDFNQFLYAHREAKSYEQRLSVQNEKHKRLDETYYDEVKEFAYDEKFVEGACVAKKCQLDYDFVKRAGDIIKDKKAEYANTNVLGRFFSYLNPFKNKYRDMRNKLTAMTDKVVEASGIDKKDFENYISGKNKELLFEKGLLNSFDRISEVEVAAENIAFYKQDLKGEEFQIGIKNDLEKDAVKADLTDEKVNDKPNLDDLQK